MVNRFYDESVEDTHNSREGYDELRDEQDVLLKATKVHTQGINLNEDAVLSSLDQEFPKQSKYVIDQMNWLNVLRSFLKVDKEIIYYDNTWDVENNCWKFKDPVVVNSPELNIFNECKLLVMSKSNSMMILSRSTKGSVLKSYLSYNRGIDEKQLGMEKKLSLRDKLMGKKEVIENE